MEKTYFDSKDFKGQDYSELPLPKGDYEYCSFTNCNFSKSDLSGIVFMECKFDNCDFSMAKIPDTALRDVKFKNCKLLGLHFENCNDFLFSVDFDSCILNLASFYKVSLKKTIFKDSSLREVDFVESDLMSAVFENCDLAGAAFSGSILEKADFRTSYNYSFDPEKNKIKKAKFSLAGVVGLLDKYDIKIE